MMSHFRQIPFIFALWIALLFPSGAYAEFPGLASFFELGVGFEDFRVDNALYDTNNFGPNVSLSFGIQIVIFAILLQQELGYIDMNPSTELMQPGESKRRKNFKGATLLLTRWCFPYVLRQPIGKGYDNYFTSGPVIELGMGGEYIRKPFYNPEQKDDYEGWFAIRLGAGYEFDFIFKQESSLKLTILFEYTLGLSNHRNYFDNQSASHFLMGKLLIGYYDRIRLSAY